MSTIAQTFVPAPAILILGPARVKVSVLGPGTNFNYRISADEARRILSTYRVSFAGFYIMRTWDEDDDWIGVDADEVISDDHIYEIWLN